MKKWLIPLLVLLVAIFAFSLAEATSYSLTIDSRGVITGYTGTLPDDLVIPSEINGVKVTGIGEKAFCLTKISSVVLPEGVTNIGKSAFKQSQIKSVKLPSTLTSIEDYAFYYCIYLTGIVIPEGVTTIGKNVFLEDDYVTSLTLPSTLHHISEGAFNQLGLTELIIPQGVETLDKHSFASNCFLTTVVLPDSLIYIHPYAFQSSHLLHTAYCPKGSYAETWAQENGLTIIYLDTPSNYTPPNAPFKLLIDKNDFITGYTGTLPNDLVIPSEVNGVRIIGIGEEAFAHANLSSLVISDGITWIDTGAFAHNYSLTSITLPNSLRVIYVNAFEHAALTELVIPSRVEIINPYAFAFNSQLTTITLPESLMTISDSAFKECPNLKTVYCYRDTYAEYWAEKHGFSVTRLPEINEPEEFFLWRINKEGVITGYEGELPDELVIPSKINGIKVTGIGENAFYCCDFFTSVTIPEGVTFIGQKAFFGCSFLKRIALPQTLISIDDAAFSDCVTLSSITFPDRLTFIGNESFAYCTSLATTALPESITSIGDSAFYYCQSLTRLTIPNSMTSIGKSAFQHCFELTIHCYKNSTADAYAQTNNIKVKYLGNSSNDPDPSTPTDIPSTPTDIPSTPTDLPSAPITLPADLITIGEEAFLGSTAEEFILPDGCTTIGARAFADSKLKSITIPASVTSIAPNAFDGCNVTITTTANSTAEAFAKIHGLKYVLLED